MRVVITNVAGFDYNFGNIGGNLLVRCPACSHEYWMTSRHYQSKTAPGLINIEDVRCRKCGRTAFKEAEDVRKFRRLVAVVGLDTEALQAFFDEHAF